MLCKCMSAECGKLSVFLDVHLWIIWLEGFNLERCESQGFQKIFLCSYRVFPCTMCTPGANLRPEDVRYPETRVYGWYPLMKLVV